MTPNDIEEQARYQYNATGDTFFSSAEIWNYIYQACLQLARETGCIEASYSTTTVNGTREYAYPTNTIAIKRVEFDGQKLQFINQRQEDALTLNNTASETSGTPSYYSLWDETIRLLPTPNAADTLTIFSVNEPQEITTGSQALEVPTRTHMGIVDFVLSKMYAKDKDFNGAKYHMELWLAEVQAEKKFQQKRKRGDRPASVNDEDTLPVSLIGAL